MTVSIPSGTEHPIALELVSLKAALDKYQHAAHTSSLQLQRAHLEAAEATAHSKTLEADNSRLQREIDFLRANPDTTPTSLHVSELTLALRRVSDKLSLTENILLQRTTELTHSLSEKSRMQLEIMAAHAELDRVRQREDACHLRERELERKCKAAEEEARMADVVVMEYADLVRTLEGRPVKLSNRVTSAPEDLSAPPSPPPKHGDIESNYRDRSCSLVQSLTENRFSLQRLLHEFNSETSHLQAEITRLHTEISSVQSHLDCERESSRMDRIKLAEALLEVDRCKTDDSAAAKIVSRYMQFSQSSINTLQAALSTVKSRHATTLATLSSSSDAVSHSLTLERKRVSQLRDVLDELTEDISRETFGRRREISLRLQSIVHEEKTMQALSAWLRRAEEKMAQFSTFVPTTDSEESPQTRVDAVSEKLMATLEQMIQDATAMLASLSHEVRSDGNMNDKSSLERVILAEDMVRSLIADLAEETEKRMALTRAMGKKNFVSAPKSSGTLVKTDPIQIEHSSLTASSNVIDSSPLQEASVSSARLDVVSESKTSSLSGEESRATDATRTNVAAQNLTSPDHVATQVLTKRTQTEEKIKIEPLPDFTSIEHSTITPEIPLLTELSHVSHRYDEMQRGFRDCHSTLIKLKADIAPMAMLSQSGIQNLQHVIHRLDDFCEDIRVELEIRIADEERIAQGFKTLLGVPGALAVDAEKCRIELELKAFLDGTTPSVVKVVESCTSKLEDLRHDIAQVKRALHESHKALPEVESHAPPKSPSGWQSWTPLFLSGSSSRPTSPAPSFGTVITTPRPRRVSSTSLFRLPSRTNSESNLMANDPYAHLGLRIPMPSQIPPGSSLHSSSANPQKTTVSSGMYLLGLASHSGIFSKREMITEGGSSEGDLETCRSDSDVE